MTEQRTAWGWGLASIDAAGNTLDVWYPELTLGEAPAETSRPNHNFGAIAHDEADARGVRRMPVFTVSKLDEPIEDAADAYLRLHLLSMRLAKPNTLNLDGIFAKLNNVVWTNYGPFAVDDFALRKLDVMAATRQSGAVLAPHVDVNVLSIDKFPRMVDYVVPTGNFGDILAGYFAKEMGLPVGKLVCASNANNVLTDFLRTGRYDRRRPFYKTVSPSMDILVSSNLERLLYLLSGDDKLIADLMKQLSENGEYEVPADMLEKLHELFWAGFCDDEGAKTAIGKVWKDDHYLCDTHTAVAWDVAQQYKQANPEHNAVVVLSTASPYKFPAAVLEGIGEKAEGDEFDVMEQLHKVTGVPVPKNLADLRSRAVRHRDVIDRGEMLDYVLGKAAAEK